MYLTAVVDNIENTENWKKFSPKFKIYQTIIGNEADVFLLCQDFLGNRLSDAINAIKDNMRSVAVMTSDTSTENQKYLCDMGADDIIFMPVCREFLMKKISILNAGSNDVLEKNNINISCFSQLEETNGGDGAYLVHRQNFGDIYKFVLRIMERLEKQCQALIFTLDKDEKSEKETDDVMDILSDAVKICLRRGDIFSVCQSNQIAIILMGADDDGGHLVANRIVSNFYSKCYDDDFSLTYDIREIEPEK